MSDISNQQIFALLTEVRTDVKAIAKQAEQHEVKIEGNGGKGLLQRQDETDNRLGALETWKGKRPEVCPATAKEITKGIGKVVGIASGILALVIGLSIFFGDRLIVDNKAAALQEQMKTLQEALDKVSN